MVVRPRSVLPTPSASTIPHCSSHGLVSLPLTLEGEDRSSDGFFSGFTLFSPPTHRPAPAPQPCRSAELALLPHPWMPLPSELQGKRKKNHPDSPRFAYSLQAVGSVLLKTCDLLFQKHLCFKNKVLSSWMWLFIIISWSAPFLSLKFYFIASSGSAKVGLTL